MPLGQRPGEYIYIYIYICVSKIKVNARNVKALEDEDKNPIRIMYQGRDVRHAPNFVWYILCVVVSPGLKARGRGAPGPMHRAQRLGPGHKALGPGPWPRAWGSGPGGWVGGWFDSHNVRELGSAPFTRSGTKGNVPEHKEGSKEGRDSSPSNRVDHTP